MKMIQCGLRNPLYPLSLQIELWTIVHSVVYVHTIITIWLQKGATFRWTPTFLYFFSSILLWKSARPRAPNYTVEHVNEKASTV